ncbi:lytic polysaccharide monooxygenase [Sporormia fimetaria CBS 119925]|uniref:AA9 family lytic polysaccharide monooxygenase n=1 Tax=Sporormia fimetaria CBS 119925 TaxID=1340428 RepID=A0A6A6V509_9PLEO|nr:lytic polysaccharide monooxygenase [Sporormia fimetaria CBS 119925]
MPSLPVLLLGLLPASVCAHSFIWSVYVNGEDQGSFKGIRVPAYNGGFGKGGYNNSPVKNLTHIDMRCNVMGDIPAPDTIKVSPGDNLTFEWHHNKRNNSDDVIDKSHRGPSLVYISPDPPTDDSFVKLWHEGLYETSEFPLPGKWSTTDNIAKNTGNMNVRIPAGLKAGYYLIRAEMIALHEGEVSLLDNPIRGAQFYPNCVQIEVVGDGDVELPKGVGFPGAYQFGEPGIVHNVYCSTQSWASTATECPRTYPIPGPTVWSGAWPETTSVSRGPRVGHLGHAPWSTWIVSSVVTSVAYTDQEDMTTLGTSTYEATWSSTYQTPAPGTKRW